MFYPITFMEKNSKHDVDRNVIAFFSVQKNYFKEGINKIM